VTENEAETAQHTKRPSDVISADFVARWEPHYDRRKYPVDFYLRYVTSARNAKSHEDLRGALLALLHWKDGKAASFARGETPAAKPNTLNPMPALSGAALAGLAQSFHGLVGAEENNFKQQAENLRNTLNQMWRSVVIPAFVLHVARPDRLPIIDNHTMRAFLYLMRGEFVEKPTINNWGLWGHYATFFEEAVANAGFGSNCASRSQVDRALFAYGKWLKEAYPREREKLLKKRALTLPATKPGFANLWDQLDAEIPKTQSRSAGRNNLAQHGAKRSAEQAGK